MIVPLEAVELVPVVELEPGRFATRERQLPAGSGRDVPAAWHRYWLDSLADSWVVGLTPLSPASWLVETRQLAGGEALYRVLSAAARGWGGPAAFAEPDGKPVLDGGLALYSNGELLIAPTCCGDLGTRSEWKDAAACRQPGWKMVWVGHPWVSVRFEEGRLAFSEPHESDAPTARWAVTPEELVGAVATAEAELEDFARRLRPALADLGVTDPGVAARTLAGLAG